MTKSKKYVVYAVYRGYIGIYEDYIGLCRDYIEVM